MSNIIRQNFWCRVPKWIKHKPPVPNNWGSSLLVLEGHRSTTSSVVFSSDGTLLASSADNGEIRLWNTVTGEARGFIQCLLEGSYASSILSPNRLLEAVIPEDYDKTIQILNNNNRKTLETLTGHQAKVTAMAFSPNGKLLASASSDSTIRLWNTATATKTRTTQALADISLAAFSPDGKLLIYAHFDGRTSRIELWETKTGKNVWTVDDDMPSFFSGWNRYIVAFSLDNRVLGISGGKTIRLINLESGVFLGQDLPWLADISTPYRALALPSDGRRVVGTLDSVMALWDLDHGITEMPCPKIFEVYLDKEKYSLAVAFSPDNNRFAFSCSDKTVRLWHFGQRYFSQIYVFRTTCESWTTRINFSACGCYIETDQGAIEIDAVRDKKTQLKPVSHLRYSLGGNWIRYGKQNILCLPSDFRPTVIDFTKTAIAWVISPFHVFFHGIGPQCSAIEQAFSGL
ncbi:hypothetical protein FPQ18DRAFT_291628 [Pyronema domesticum]|nr:hypothetical protein FPQ18DRAFT_291628 [Pyronema domesticum]